MTPYNPWATLTTSAESQSGALRAGLLDMYGSPTCLLSGIEQQQDKKVLVVAAHLWPKARAKEFAQWENQNGETICSSIDDTANGMLLLQGIERAYDKQRVIFLCDPFEIALQLRVLDPSLKSTCPTGCPWTFEQLEQCRIGRSKIDEDRRPSFKVLSYHASVGVRAAVSKGWLSQDECDNLLLSITVTSPLKGPAARGSDLS
jgi:hypothetical protein